MKLCYTVQRLNCLILVSLSAVMINFLIAGIFRFTPTEAVLIQL